MKKLALSILIFITLCTTLCACSSYTAQDGYKVVASDSCSFCFDVPSDWEITYTDTMLAANDPADKSNVVGFAVDTQEVMGADNYWETYKQNYEETFGQINITEFSETSLDGVIARKVVFDITIDDVSYTCQTIICSRYNTIYTLTFTSLNTNYQTRKEQFDTITSTFRFV